MKFIYLFLLYNIVLVLPYINMNLPQVYTCSPSWTPPPSSLPVFDGLLVFLVLSYMSCLYILEINPLSVVSFTIIFSHSESCLFTLLIVFFAVQKLLSLIRSHLFTFVFISITPWGGSQRILLWFMSSSVLPVFLIDAKIFNKILANNLPTHQKAHKPRSSWVYSRDARILQ